MKTIDEKLAVKEEVCVLDEKMIKFLDETLLILRNISISYLMKNLRCSESKAKELYDDFMKTTE